MNFLDEAVYNVEKGAMPPDPESLDKDDVVNIGEKKLDPIGKEDDDINNDGKVNSTDKYLANKRKAIAKALLKSKKTIKKEDLEEGMLSRALGGAAVLASLLLVGKINSDDPVVQRLQAEYEQAEPAQQDSIKTLMTKRLIFLDTGKFDDSTPMDESLVGSLAKGIGKFISGDKIDFTSMLKGLSDLTPPSPDDEKTITAVKDSIEDGEIPFKIKSKEEKEFFEALKRSGAKKEDIEDVTKTIEALRKAEAEKKAKKDEKPEDKEVKGVGGKTLVDPKGNPLTKSDSSTPMNEETITGEYEGKPVNFKIKDIPTLKDIIDVSISAKDFVNKVTMAVTDETSSLSEEDIKKLILFYKKRNIKEVKDIKLPGDTTFTLDLKHLTQKHMNKGHSKEKAIEITKRLMKKLHNKGKIEIDGTEIKFIKEADVPMDMPMALPEPDAPDYLGNDGMDYEGGMAKSQMLKMKKYAVALCDMIEDESQLESWVQAKLTKASDYMSSVYHYLDYQKSKMK